jgi:hypothetical protein
MDQLPVMMSGSDLWLINGINRVYLDESTTDEAEARRILNVFRAQVDEQRNARTRALFRIAIEEWLNVHELEESIRRGYEPADW